jgi:RNA polymerase sigma-70 factor (ECF subfamily)
MFPTSSVEEVLTVTEMEPDEAVARAFDEQRGRLMAVAYRMLGSRVDAEDAVQEAWLRLARQDAKAIDNLAGWLTTVVGRVCIDVLRSRRTRPEVSYDERLPELVVAEDVGARPEDQSVLAESVGLALMVVLDSLRPAERLAFVLHDMFAVSFEEIGHIIGTSSDAAKMHAWRARRKVQGTGTPRPTAERDGQRAVVDAFLAASRDGDFDALLRVLDPNVTWRVHTRRGAIVREGVGEVLDKAQRTLHAKVAARRVLVNGEPGIAVWSRDGSLRAVMACTVTDGRMVHLESVTDPAVLASIDLPATPV